jgi:hypothetical protein
VLQNPGRACTSAVSTRLNMAPAGDWICCVSRFTKRRSVQLVPPT